MSLRGLTVVALLCCACGRSQMSLPPPNVPDLPAPPPAPSASVPAGGAVRSFETKTIGEDRHPASRPASTEPSPAAAPPGRSGPWSPTPVYGDKNPSPPGAGTPLFGDPNPSPPGR